MTATQNKICDLIERPAGSRRYRSHAMHDTPHGQAMAERLVEANAAIAGLLGMGCLIEHVKLTPDVVRVQLVRCPKPGVLDRHSTHHWWYEKNAPGEAMRGLCWRGVLIEWPIHNSDVPAIEAAP